MNFSNSGSSLIRLLVVDDYPNAANLLARSLSRLDTRLNVVSATSAHQALEYVENSAVHILITDMDLPEMTGLELIDKLQKLAVGNRIVSFLISASYTQELKIKARELSVREIFCKPVHPERICEFVSRVLEEMHEEHP